MDNAFGIFYNHTYIPRTFVTFIYLIQMIATCVLYELCNGMINLN